ncbi:ParB/RepB/Spo0J family partition protein [Amycolatopsis stemonae]
MTDAAAEEQTADEQATGDDTKPDQPTPVEESEPDGVNVELLDPAVVAPHPFNDPERSEPEPGDPEWDELRSSVIEHGGNFAAGLVVTVAAFLRARPQLTGELPRNAEYVAIYGHRRRAAALDTGNPFKAEIDDSVMENDGDLRRLNDENKGRKGFTELQEARMLAKSINAGVSQRRLAAVLNGYTQPTISRRLALLHLAPEAMDAVNGTSELYVDETGKPKKLPMAEAAVIAGKFPYADPAQKFSKQESSLAPEQRSAQTHVLKTLNTRGEQPGWNATRACEYVARVIDSVTTAKKLNVEIISPRKMFGPEMHNHRLTDEAGITKATRAGTLVAEVDSTSGDLVFYTTAKPKPKKTEPTGTQPTGTQPTGTQPTKTQPTKTQPTKTEPSAYELAMKAEEKAKREARALRMPALTAMVKKHPAQKDMVWLMARDYHNGLAQLAGNGDAGRLAEKLWHDANLEPTLGDQFREQMEANDDPKLDLHAAWVRMCAARELHLRARTGHWGAIELQYFEMLDRLGGGYNPTEWEAGQLELARQKLAAAEDESSEDPDDADEAEDADDADEDAEDADDADADDADAEDADDADDAEDADDADDEDADAEDADDADAEDADDADDADDEDADAEDADAEDADDEDAEDADDADAEDADDEDADAEDADDADDDDADAEDAEDADDDEDADADDADA